jgi:voltage-gated potassium channel
MEKKIKSFKNHFIVCGMGRVGMHVVNELRATNRVHVIIDMEDRNIEEMTGSIRDQIFIRGDATDELTLQQAGIDRASGIFASTGDDSRNLVISFTAKQLNPNIRVVVRCHEPRNIEKIKKTGADAVISPDHIGGLRMGAEMFRPTVVSFLDKNIRFEEIALTKRFIGRPLSALKLWQYPGTILVGVKTKESWIYKPAEDYIIKPENALIIITNPDERRRLENLMAAN